MSSISSSSTMQRPASSHPSSSLLLFLLLTLLFLSAPSCILSATSTQFLADLQPLFVTATGSVHNATSNLTTYSVNVPLTFSYLNSSLLVYSNATTVTATLTSSTTATFHQLPASASQTSNSLSYTPTILLLSFTSDTPNSRYAAMCHSYLPNPCPVTIALSTSIPPTSSPPTFSLFSYSLISLPIGHTASSTLTAGSWQYYSTYITASDLDVFYDLRMSSPTRSSTTADVDFYLSSDVAPLLLLFPDPTNAADYHQPGSEEGVLLLSSGGSDGFTNGVYITGIFSPPTSAAVTAFTLQIQGGVNIDTGSQLGLSLFYIIGALAVLVLCLCGFVGVIARRRRSAIREFNESMAAAAIAEDVQTMRRLQERATARGLTASGLMQAPVFNGATEEEIRAIPEFKFKKRAGGDDDDMRCSVCLDEYQDGVSVVKKLGCGHQFHSECIGTWLGQRRHCPLCLQNVRDAHNVAKPATVVEMQPMIAAKAGMEVSTASADDGAAGDGDINVVNVHEEERKEQ